MSQINLNDLVILGNKRGTRNRDGMQKNIYISFRKNKNNYVEMKFYIGEEICNKLQINKNTKIKFAYNKNDINIFYLLLGIDGYTLTKEKNSNSYSSSMASAFHYIERKMVCIPDTCITLHEQQQIIELSVHSVFIRDELKPV